MTKNNANICDLIIAAMGDQGALDLENMPDSEKFNLQLIITMMGYKIIIRLSREGYTVEQIMFKTGENYKQVTRVIAMYDNGTYTP